MGCTTNKVSPKLPEHLREKALEIFKQIDTSQSGIIDKEATQKFWKSTFAKISTDALFSSADLEKSGGITEDVWLAFWEIVRKSGYTEAEIDEVMDDLMKGEAWIQLRKVDRFIKTDEKRKSSVVKTIVLEERRRLSVFQPAQGRKLHKSRTMQTEIQGQVDNS